MPLPDDVLAKLASLSGYDQMLEMDAASRNYGLSLAQIESEMAAYKANSNRSQPGNVIEDFTPVAYKEEVDLSVAQTINATPTYIDNPDNYRLKYDPPSQGISNQSQVRQAIICPTCSAPLGIPDIRPIKVTCPQCGAESVFHN